MMKVNFEDSDEGDSKLEIIEVPTKSGSNPFKSIPVYSKNLGQNEHVQKMLENPSSAAEAIESLLLLGQEPVVSQPNSLLSTNKPINTAITVQLNDDSSVLRPSSSGEEITYYQRMRVRNNAASKRCRLRRRLKAEQQENQHNLLLSSNKLLKSRIARIDKICGIIKGAVADIQKGNPDCTCYQAIESIKAYNREHPDPCNMSNRELLNSSQKHRELKFPETSLQLDESNSDDGNNSTIGCYKRTPYISKCSISRKLAKPLGLVSIGQQEGIRLYPASPINFLGPKLTNGISEDFAKDIKKEIKEEKSENVFSCIASLIHSPVSSSPCAGEMFCVDKLMQSINISNQSVSVLERAVIKSSLGLPFWQSEESEMFICQLHRKQVSSLPNSESSCSVCGKNNQSKKIFFNRFMHSITYRMSLQYHTMTGDILPIGHLVCTYCKEKHFPNSSPIQNTNEIQSVIENSPTVCLSNDGLKQNVKVLVQPVMSRFPDQPISLNSMSLDSPASVQIATTETLAPTTAKSNIFHKITKLNDALQSVNPQYKPLGFSITSIESCSSGVLEDTIKTTATAVSTILSVIAPDQESLLWESVKRFLDEKYHQPS